MFSLKLMLPTIIISSLPFIIDWLQFLPQPFLIDNFRHYFRNKQISLGQRQKIIQYLKSVIITYSFWIALFACLQFYWIKKWFGRYCKKQKILEKLTSSKTLQQKIENIDYQPVEIDQVRNNQLQVKQYKKKKQKFNSKIYFSQKAVLLTMFLIFFLSVVLTNITQKQSLRITHQFKFGKGNWMGINQYFSLDFFHNLPKEFKNNQILKTLFLQQDKALSSLRSFVLNYRLIFGLFRLSYESVGFFFFVFLLISFFLLNSRKNIQSQIEHIVEHSAPKHHKKKTSLRITLSLALVNVLILVFFAFLTLASIFSQIKLLNTAHICTKSEFIGGFTINFIPQTQVKIYELVQQSQFAEHKKDFQSQQQVQTTINRHNIIFLYENLCEITNPFFVKIKFLQSQILYVFRVGYLFLLYMILAINQKFKLHKEQKKSQRPIKFTHE